MQTEIVNHPAYPLPEYATVHSAGLDLRASTTEVIQLILLQRILISTRLFFELHEGSEAQIRPRSRPAVKHGISIVNSPVTIDPDYRGEIKIVPVNLSDTFFDRHPDKYFLNDYREI